VKRRTYAAGLVALVMLMAAPSGASLTTSRWGVKVVAEFTDAGAIIAGNDVRVDGVAAGRVAKVELGHDGLARLTLSIGAAFAPLHTDASVAIRPVSLLGERFVDLDRGSPSATVLTDGAVIPAARTRRSVDLQEILDAVDQPTGAALAALLVGLGAGMAGRGGDAAAAAAALAPAFTRTDELMKILDEQNRLLGAVIDRAAPVLSALGSERGGRLDRLVAATGTLLGATAAARPELDEGLHRLPVALESARSALAGLAALAGQTTPVLASLRPVTGDLNAIAAELGAFADAAGPALTSLDPVLDRGAELIAAARPVVAELAAAGGDFERMARSGRSLAEAFPQDLSNLLDFIRNVALASAGADGISHYLRIFALSRDEALNGRFPKGPPGAPGSGTASLASLAPTPSSPGAAGPVAPAPAPAIPPVVPRIGSRPAPDPGSATGLSAGQERALLDYLLGAH